MNAGTSSVSTHKLSPLPVSVQHLVQKGLGTRVDFWKFLLPGTSGSLMPAELPNSRPLLPGDKIVPTKLLLQTKYWIWTKREGSVHCPSTGTAGTRTHQSTCCCYTWAFTKTCHRVRKGPVLFQLTHVKIHKTIMNTARVREIQAWLYRKFTPKKYHFQKGLFCASQESFMLQHTGTLWGCSCTEALSIWSRSKLYFKHCFRVLTMHNMALKNTTQSFNCKFVMLFESGARSDQTINFRDFYTQLRGEDAGWDSEDLKPISISAPTCQLSWDKPLCVLGLQVPFLPLFASLVSNASFLGVGCWTVYACNIKCIPDCKMLNGSVMEIIMSTLSFKPGISRTNVTAHTT